MTRPRIKAYSYLLVVALIWGVAGPVIKYTLPDFPPMIFLSYRFLISILVLTPVVIIKKPKLPKQKRDFFMLTLIGLLGSSINLGLLFYGYNYTTALDASLLSATSPIFVVAASALFLKEHVTKQERYGVLLTFFGTLAIVLEPLIDGGLFSYDNLLGNILIILANITWVLYVIFSKLELKQKMDPLFMTLYMFLLGFLSTLPLAIIQSRSLGSLINIISSAPLRPHLGVLYMAILSGSLAYFLYQRAQKTIEASEATLFGYLSPIFAAPLAVFWLGEKITIHFVFGALIIALGVFVAEHKKKKII